MSCGGNDGNNNKTKCCDKSADTCPKQLTQGCCPNVPNTLTFQCPCDSCPKPKPFCPEKKSDDDKCTCIGKCDQKKC